jgi:hypothetical protein
MDPDVKVLFLAQVIPPGHEPFLGKLLHLNMLVMTEGGRMRTVGDYTRTNHCAGGGVFLRP